MADRYKGRSYIYTLTRKYRDDNGNPHQRVKVWRIKNGEPVYLGIMEKGYLTDSVIVLDIIVNAEKWPKTQDIENMYRKGQITINYIEV